MRGDAQQLPLPDARFDLVNCCGALHLFPDPVRALAEAQRVLRPGGHITLSAVRRDEGRLDEIANRWRRRWLGLDSFTAAELTGRMRAAGFEEPPAPPRAARLARGERPQDGVATDWLGGLKRRFAGGTFPIATQRPIVSRRVGSLRQRSRGQNGRNITLQERNRFIASLSLPS